MLTIVVVVVAIIVVNSSRRTDGQRKNRTETIGYEGTLVRKKPTREPKLKLH